MKDNLMNNNYPDPNIHVSSYKYMPHAIEYRNLTCYTCGFSEILGCNNES